MRSSSRRTPDILTEELRWMSDLRVELFSDVHSLGAVMGVVSVSVWSIGFVALLYVAVCSGR